MLRFIILSLLAICVNAQNSDILGSIFSDARSIFTLVTSILGPPQSAATTSTSAASTSSSSSSEATSTSSSSSSASQSSASPSSSPTITSAPATSSLASSSATASSVVSNAAAATSAASNSNGGGGGSNTLAIVLGCTLGALALAAFLALLWLCLRRRRKRNAQSKHRSIPPDDEEVESWRHEKPRVSSFKGPETFSSQKGTSFDHAPLMTERGHEHGSDHRNPFVPVPPPARRTSRNGLDDTEYSAHPYSPEQVNGQSSYPQHEHHHGGRNAMAAAAGGAALGGLAAHARDRHERNRSASRGRHATDQPFSEDEHNALPQATTAHRRSGSINRANAKEPWPYADEHRTSVDMPRARRRSTSRSQEQYMTPSQHPWEHEAMPAAGVALAGMGAGALATHHHHHQSERQRKGILKQTYSDSTNPISTTDDSQSSTPFVDAPLAHNSGPHELASNHLPDAPSSRPRPTSALGTAAPLAAIGAVGAAATARARSSSGGRSKRRSTHSTSDAANRFSSSSDSHGLPPRSPKRVPMDARARYSTDNDGTVEMPSGIPAIDVQSTKLDHDHGHNIHALQQHGTVSPPFEAERDDDGIRSPVSPITNSNPGTWSTAQAEELGMVAPLNHNVSSPENNIRTNPSSEHTSDGSDQHSSGLVSAIQKIFSSQRTAWADEDGKQDHETRLLEEPGTAESPRISKIPHRRPAPQNPMIRKSQHGEIDSPYVTGETVHNQPSDLPPSPVVDRRSMESAHSLPPQYRSRANSGPRQTAVNDFAPTTPPNVHGHNRARSRSGYGLGSGDPYDLARTRTDSSMTGISLSNYQDASHPPRTKTSSGSFTKNEPTLAELRQQVQQEDRERARRSLDKHRRSGSSGLRYGDDRELFNLIDQTTGRADYDNDSNRFYARRSGRTSGDVGRAM